MDTCAECCTVQRLRHSLIMCAILNLQVNVRCSHRWREHHWDLWPLSLVTLFMDRLCETFLARATEAGHINLLKLRALFSVLQHFRPLIRGSMWRWGSQTPPRRHLSTPKAKFVHTREQPCGLSMSCLVCFVWWGRGQGQGHISTPCQFTHVWISCVWSSSPIWRLWVWRRWLRRLIFNRSGSMRSGQCCVMAGARSLWAPLHVGFAQ